MAAKKASVGSARKTAKRKVARKAATKTIVSKKLPSIKDPLNKTGIIRALTDMNGTSRKDVVSLLEGLGQLIELHVKSRGPGKFILPGLLKISVVKKPAMPARKGINPFTGEMTTFKAKPARRVLKIRALKKLKEMAE